MYSYKNQLALFEIVVIFHFTFYSVFDNVNAALVSIKDDFEKKQKNLNYSYLLIGSVCS